ncbi:piggyBac transposable element-derived protein 3-like [Diadema antillarum]|uniref:piggyBac transposable element-derived protein 3-like n=1 Tax=Diadema antillarum TaxID=105358 RepID=UPI003A85B09D
MDRKQSINESMILFKGRSTLKQYNPMKPIKRGYKIWARADNSGYIGQFEVYQGKGGNADVQLYPDNYGYGEKVIHTFTRPLTGKNYTVFFDNHFSSVRLMEDLKEDKVLACGTIRTTCTCNLPDLTDDKQPKERGEFDYRISEKDIRVFKWKDNKLMHVISNYHGTEETTVRRTMKDGTKKEVKCPIAIADYNENMGDVDKADMLRTLDRVNQKSMKWWHRIFWGILDITFVNAYVVYQSMFGKMPLIKFRRKVTMGLLTLAKPMPSAPKRGRPSSPGAAQPPPTKLVKRRKTGFSVPDDVRMQNPA